MRNPNILFSTTRQWNPGDEFIFFGIKNLLHKIGVSFNAIYYNRHPGVTPRKYWRKNFWSLSHPLPHWDNSFSLEGINLIDYVIFAGTPEWFGGPRIKPLLEYILRNKLRCAFLGVGVHKHQVFSDALVRVLKDHADLIVARDPLCYELVRNYENSFYLPCPALFAATHPKPRQALKHLGLGVQASITKHHALAPEVMENLFEQYSKLEGEFSVQYIAHYIDDIALARKWKKDVLYSGNSEDYLQIYDQFDCIVSTRVHGCGLASSLGIPNFLVAHDGRAATANKFLSKIISQDDCLNLLKSINSLNLMQNSAGLITHRNQQEEKYLELLSTRLSVKV